MAGKEQPRYVAVCPDCGETMRVYVEVVDRWSVTHRDPVRHESGRPKRVMELTHYGTGKKVQ